MDSKRFTRRLVALGAAMFFCALVFVVTLFDAQIVNGDDYLAQSIRTNAKSETVKASRGVITDRNGKVLVSNRAVYTLNFDSSLVSSDEPIILIKCHYIYILAQSVMYLHYIHINETGRADQTGIIHFPADFCQPSHKTQPVFCIWIFISYAPDNHTGSVSISGNQFTKLVLCILVRVWIIKI